MKVNRNSVIGLSYSIAYLFIVINTLIFIPAYAYAHGGISLGATRVIYPADAKSESITVSNSSVNARYLIQAWVDDATGKKTTDFIVTPPLFNSMPGTENRLKIIGTRSVSQTDREQVYYLNIKNIPVINKKDIEGKNMMVVTVSTRIKLFVRPKGLMPSLSDAAGRLAFNYDTGKLKAVNPTPYYLTMTDVRADGKALDGLMVPPYSSVVLADFRADSVSWKVINDYGGTTSEHNATVTRVP